MESELVTVYVSEPDIGIQLESLFENPYEVMVIHGNRNYRNHESASWYKRALELYHHISNDIDCGVDWYDPQYDDCSEEVWRNLYDVIENEEVSDSDEGIVFILSYLYPDWKFDYGTIRGYCQSDWQDVIFRSDLTTKDEIETVYFNKMYLLNEDGTGTCGYVSHNKYWKAEMHKDGVEKLVREELDLGDEIDIQILKKDSGDKKWNLVY